jgi:3-oxoacyl-[acyl-carrier protein] reductase
MCELTNSAITDSSPGGVGLGVAIRSVVKPMIAERWDSMSASSLGALAVIEPTTRDGRVAHGCPRTRAPKLLLPRVKHTVVSEAGYREEKPAVALSPLGVGVSGRADLTDRVAVVTGGARGIGRAIAEALAGAGARVVLLDVGDPSDAVRSIVSTGAEAIGLACDVRSRSDVESAIARTLQTFGRIDILVNNAGVIERSSLEALDEATYAREVDVVLIGTYLCTQAVYEPMKRQGGGKIVNISSISGKLGGAVSRETGASAGRSGPAYAAVKGGILAFTKWVAKDAGRYGICVNAVCPGPVSTEMTHGYDYGVASQPIARMGEPADVAMAVLFFASQMSNYVTGQSLNVDAGILMD